MKKLIVAVIAVLFCASSLLAAQQTILGGSGVEWGDEKDKINSNFTELYGAKSADEVEVSEIGTSTHDDVQAVLNSTQSSGKISGGTFTTNGDGSCTVSAGTGFIRATNSDLAEVLSFDWAEDATVSLTDNNTNYIYVDYNSGTPDIKSTTTVTVANNRDKILLGKIYREGTALHEVEAGMVVSELARRVLVYLNSVNGEIVRGTGLVTTETGDLGIAVTAGTGFGGLTALSWSAIDSTGADTFRLWYNDSAWQDSVVSVIETTQYNNYGVGLANYSNNHFGTFYVYMHFEGDLHIVYGIDSYATLSEAELAPTPANLPSLVNDFSLYIGKIIIQQGATSAFVDVRYPWTDSTATGLTSDHGDLSGLTDDDHPQYEDELTNSAGLAAALSDETGTGAAVLANSPTLVTPDLGAATADSLTIAGTASGGQVATLLEDTDNGTNYVGIGSPAANANDLILLLPTSDPTAGQTLIGAAPSSVTFSDGVARDASQLSWFDPRFESIAVADLSDTSTPSVLTAAETTNKAISNYKSSGADHVFTMPAAHSRGNVIFPIGDEFQVDVEPDTGANFYLNGTAMAANEHIQNTADTLGQRLVGYCVNINGTLTWMFYSSDTDFVEETP